MYGNGWDKEGISTTTNKNLDAGSSENPRNEISFDDNPAQPYSGSLQRETEEVPSWGIIPRAIAELFRCLEAKSSSGKPFDFAISKFKWFFLSTNDIVCLFFTSNDLYC